MFGNGFKVKRQKFGIGSLVFLLLFGTAFVGAGFLVINGVQIDSSWQRTNGEVVDVYDRTDNGSTTYAPVVKYSVNEQEYQMTGSLSSSFMPTIGEQREIAYNPQQPNEAKLVEGIGATWWLRLFPVFGIGMMVVALISFIRSLKRSNTINDLVRTGHKVQGILTDIQSTGGNNNGSYKIVISATDIAGVVQNYVSDSLNNIAGLAMADFRNNPIPIDVYIDPTKPQNYYVDISDIPNLTPERIAQLIQSAVKTAGPQTIVTAAPPTSSTDDMESPVKKS
ncbi:MAG: DUF3592 domain-containing protein [Sphaerimonospora mesophila]